MEPRYVIINEHDQPTLSFDQIEDCKDWIAEDEFHVTREELEKMCSRSRYHHSFGAFRAADGRTREIVSTEEFETQGEVLLR